MCVSVRVCACRYMSMYAHVRVRAYAHAQNPAPHCARGVESNGEAADNCQHLVLHSRARLHQRRLPARGRVSRAHQRQHDEGAHRRRRQRGGSQRPRPGHLALDTETEGPGAV